MGKQLSWCFATKITAAIFGLDYIPSKIAKNYQKPPFWSYPTTTTTKQKQPQRAYYYHHINKQLSTIRKVARSEKNRLQNSATYRQPIKIKQINYRPKIMATWAHQQQVAGNDNHEYPRRSHLTDISLANSWRRDVKKHINTIIISPINCQLWWMPDLINGGTSEGGTYFKLPRLCPYKEPSRIADYILTTL